VQVLARHVADVVVLQRAAGARVLGAPEQVLAALLGDANQPPGDVAPDRSAFPSSCVLGGPPWM
jgi:hypothetical protein